MAEILGITFSLVVFIAIIFSASYLQQIRNILRDMRDVQRKLAARMGVPLRDLEARAPARGSNATSDARRVPARR